MTERQELRGASDARIAAEICERLRVHPDIAADHIRVVVEEGIVTLTGAVPNHHLKRLAEEVAAEVQGALGVENELRVAQPGEPVERGLLGEQSRQAPAPRDVASP